MSLLMAIVRLLIAAILWLVGGVVTLVVSQVVLLQLPRWARGVAKLVALVAAVIAPRGRDLSATWRAELEEAQSRGVLGVRLAAGFLVASVRMRRPTRRSLQMLFRIAAASCFVGAAVGVLVLGATSRDGVPLPSGPVGATVPGGIAFALFAELFTPPSRRIKSVRSNAPDQCVSSDDTGGLTAHGVLRVVGTASFVSRTFHSDVMERLAPADGAFLDVHSAAADWAPYTSATRRRLFRPPGDGKKP